MATKKQKPLPDQIYVTREMEPNDPDYLTASETTDDIESGETVGIYRLEATRTKRVTHDLK